MASWTVSEVAVEREHVHKVYSQIAAHFSHTRHKPWPRIAEFLEGLPRGSIVADVGKLALHDTFVPW